MTGNVDIDNFKLLSVDKSNIPKRMGFVGFNRRNSNDNIDWVYCLFECTKEEQEYKVKYHLENYFNS